MRSRTLGVALVAGLCCLMGSASLAQQPSESQAEAQVGGPPMPSASGAIDAVPSKPDAAKSSTPDLRMPDGEGNAAPVAEMKRNPSLPHELSPLAMFQQADWVVKGVMIGLALASIVSWTVWLFKTFELYSGLGRLRRDLTSIATDASLSAATKSLRNARGVLPALIEAATVELKLSRDAPDRAGIKERVASRIDRVESAAIRAMGRGLGVVASIGSTAPFVGLFGTVWGIMNSFIGISKSQTTNLAVVAPGIAEALLATAAGLAAAIPAVLIYNWFSRASGGYRSLVGDASAEVLRLVSRDLDRVDISHRALAAE